MTNMSILLTSFLELILILMKITNLQITTDTFIIYLFTYSINIAHYSQINMLECAYRL